MIVLGTAVAAVAAFVLSSTYYTLATPWEVRALGDRAPDRGQPALWKVLAELARTAVVAAAFAWIAAHAEVLSLPGALLLALLLWAAFPVVLLSGSVMWEGVPPVTAAMHAGDWLLKLMLIAVIVALLH